MVCILALGGHNIGNLGGEQSVPCLYGSIMFHVISFSLKFSDHFQRVVLDLQ